MRNCNKKADYSETKELCINCEYYIEFSDRCPNFVKGKCIVKSGEQ